MAVNSLASLGGLADNSTGSTKDKSALGKDEFVKLLLAQIGNQDPLNPQDNAAMVAQMATFSQVELLQNASSRLDQLLLAQASSNQTQAAGLIGRDVRYKNDTIELGGSGSVQLGGTLKGDARNVTWTVVDSSGRTVRTLRQTDVAQGSAVVAWDGRDENGQRVPPGTYSFRVAADDGNGGAVDSSSEATGHVSGVSFEKGFAELIVGGRRIALSSVLSLSEATPSSSN
jgi:flagellar basal-body rod modification protein FlgD